MFGLPVLEETVIRHRGASRDENGKLVAAASDVPLTAIGVDPGAGSRDGGSRQVDRSRDGETIVCTVYFPTGTDLVNSDELTVRGERFRIIVNDWRTPPPLPGGLEVLCTRGQG